MIFMLLSYSYTAQSMQEVCSVLQLVLQHRRLATCWVCTGAHAASQPSHEGCMLILLACTVGLTASSSMASCACQSGCVPAQQAGLLSARPARCSTTQPAPYRWCHATAGLQGSNMYCTGAHCLTSEHAAAAAHPAGWQEESQRGGNPHEPGQQSLTFDLHHHSRAPAAGHWRGECHQPKFRIHNHPMQYKRVAAQASACSRKVATWGSVAFGPTVAGLLCGESTQLCLHEIFTITMKCIWQGTAQADALCAVSRR